MKMFWNKKDIYFEEPNIDLCCSCGKWIHYKYIHYFVIECNTVNYIGNKSFLVCKNCEKEFKQKFKNAHIIDKTIMERFSDDNDINVNIELFYTKYGIQSYLVMSY